MVLIKENVSAVQVYTDIIPAYSLNFLQIILIKHYSDTTVDHNLE